MLQSIRRQGERNSRVEPRQLREILQEIARWAVTSTIGLSAACSGYPDPGIVGRNINLNGNSLAVAGILRADFLLNHEVVPTVAGIDKADVHISLALPADAQQKQRGNENFNVLARLKPGVTFRQAQADIDMIASHIRDVPMEELQSFASQGCG